MSLGKKVFAEWSDIQKKRPAPILPELAPYEMATNLTDEARSVLFSVATNIAILNAYLETDKSYLLNDRLYDALKKLVETMEHLNKHLKSKRRKWEVIQDIAKREHTCLAKILTQLGTNSWSGIERFGAEELEILKAINTVKPVLTQFPE